MVGSVRRESRSAYWEEVVNLVERSRQQYRAFDPDESDPEDALENGVEPIVTLYVDACRDGVELAPVEQSLLEGVLNDWLDAYARSRGLLCPGGYTLHELATVGTEYESIQGTVEAMLDG